DGENHGTVNSLGHNLIGNNTGFSFSPIPRDLIGTASSPIEPVIIPLENNGGPTPTHALLMASPAIDAGDNSAAPGNDQRGLSRILDGNGDNLAVIDIGAFERSGTEAPGEPLTTTTVTIGCPADRTTSANVIPDLR